MSNPLTQSAHFWSAYPEFHLTQEELKRYANQAYRKETVFYQLFLLLSLPHRKTLQSIAHIIEPLPGAGKASCVGRQVKRLAYRIFYLLLTPATCVGGGLPLAMLSQTVIFGTLSASAIVSATFLFQILCGYILLFLISLPFYCCAYYCKPMVRYSTPLEEESHRTSCQSDGLLHIRSFNVGCTYTTTEIVGDLRPAERRIDEIGHWIEEGAGQPDIICFLEVFHQGAREKLHERMKSIYPYVVHHLAPHCSGLDSGFMIASKVPIEQFSFYPFNDMMIGPERLTNRGLAKIRITAQTGLKFDIYVTHLQALLGRARAEMRQQQIAWILSKIRQDQRSGPPNRWVLLGDMNASEHTVWGEENDEDAEFHNKTPVVELVNLHTTRQQTEEKRWVVADTPEGVEGLEAPTGTWYTGPWENKGLCMTCKEMIERVVYGAPTKKVCPALQDKLAQCPHLWGTPSWDSVQQACSAVFDRAYVPEKQPKDYLEIRRVKVIKGTESAPSDHLAIDCLLETQLKTERSASQ